MNDDPEELDIIYESPIILATLESPVTNGEMMMVWDE